MIMLGVVVRSEAQQLNYQAIARNANGVALTFRDVGIRLSIRDGSANGSIVYSETRNVRTNQFGLFTVVIGSPGASNVLGSMASINWISGNKYLQVEIDPEGGNNYFQAGASQLQAVPYALFANAAYPVGPAGGDLLGSTYPNPIIAPLAVTTPKIANQTVTTPKIADLNITTAKLANQSITNPKIQDNTIANIKLVNSKVTLNGLTLNLGDAQDFSIGRNGTDVNIVSVGTTHTFNFPDASIVNRGLLNSSDFSNFNTAYTSRITGLTTTGSIGPATLSGNVLNIPNYSYTLPAASATTLGGIIPGANITNTSGTISITSNNVINALGSQTANRFLVAPNGANGLPTFREMATGDIPDNIVTNSKLANSSINIGTTNIPLGTTANTLLGLTSVTSGAFVGPLTGNASTASTWANQRTLSLTGDVTYTSNPFDGSANTTGVATLANSGVTAGIYGAANSIPIITVDAKGRLTSVSTNLISGVSTLGSSLNSGNIIVGSAANIAAQVTMTGDVTITNTGVTGIGNGKVTDAMLAPGITDGKLATISTLGKVANSATTATEFNTPNTIVSRDGSGNFTAGNITANLTGNVTGTAANVTGIVLGANGGTGVPNSGRTMTLGGNVVTAGDLTTAGAFATTLTSTGATNVTLPTTGTLSTLAGIETLTNKTISIPTINFSNNAAVNAGSDAQGSGIVTNDINIISSTPTSPSGITLPNGIAGRRIIIVNRGTNPINVYPVNGAQIDLLGNDNPYNNIPANGYLEFFATSANQWYSSSNKTLTTQWNTIGNSGLTAGTNFLGTTDNVALQFKVGGTFAGQIHPTLSGNLNTSFGLLSYNTTAGGTQNTAFGAGALGSNNGGKDNTAIGQGALASNKNLGNNNTGVGQGALSSNETGTSNVAVGQASLRAIVNTDRNTAVGRASIENITSGTDNTVLGYIAGRNHGTTFSDLETNTVTSLSQSVMIGSYTRPSASGSQNEIVIGHNAVGNGSNTIQLGNTNITSVKTTGVINAAGSIFSFAEKSAAYTITDNDYYIKVTSAATITLPPATSRTGRKFVIFNHHSSSNSVTSLSNLVGFGNTSNSINVTSMRSLSVVSDGTSWLIESNSFF